MNFISLFTKKLIIEYPQYAPITLHKKLKHIRIYTNFRFKALNIYLFLNNYITVDNVMGNNTILGLVEAEFLNYFP